MLVRVGSRTGGPEDELVVWLGAVKQPIQTVLYEHREAVHLELGIPGLRPFGQHRLNPTAHGCDADPDGCIETRRGRM